MTWSLMTTLAVIDSILLVGSKLHLARWLSLLPFTVQKEKGRVIGLASLRSFPRKWKCTILFDQTTLISSNQSRIPEGWFVCKFCLRHVEEKWSITVLFKLSFGIMTKSHHRLDQSQSLGLIDPKMWHFSSSKGNNYEIWTDYFVWASPCKDKRRVVLGRILYCFLSLSSIYARKLLLA